MALPAEITEVLRPHLADVVDQIIDTIPREVPSYARPIEGRFGAGLRRGTQVALDRFLNLPGTRSSALGPESRQVYIALGAGEVRQGRSLESLLAAYRSGARVTFRHLSRVAEAGGMPTSVLIPLGESIFAYIEELSAASVEGYSLEQSERVGELGRRRDELAELLVRGRADETALRQAAAAAAWSLPERLVAVSVPLERSDGLRLALGNSALALARPTDVVALAPAPTTGSARHGLDRALRGRAAVVGPTRGWQRLPESLRLALTARSMLASGRLQVPVDGGVLWVADHLVELAVHTEPGLLEDLATTRLRPLADLRAGQRRRLVETLAAWLRHRGRRQDVAEELGVHPQTVAYRVAQLRDLFGEDLEDPDVRFELELLLRAGHG